MDLIILIVRKSISGNTKWKPMAPDDILRYNEVKRLFCARHWTLFTALSSPVIESLKQTVWSDVWFILVEPVHQNQTEASETVLQVTKWKILWFLIIYGKRLADDFIYFRSKTSMFPIIIGCCNNIIVLLHKQTSELNQFFKTNCPKGL